MNETSRYHGIDRAEITLPDGRTVAYLRRRWLPQPESLADWYSHTVGTDQPGLERLDQIAAHYYNGDPTQFWQICDANRAMLPEELETSGRELRITHPAYLAAGSVFSL